MADSASMRKSTAAGIMVKAPVAGNVKTRLAASIGQQQAVNAWLWIQYFAGVDPHTLTRYYRYRVPDGKGG